MKKNNFRYKGENNHPDFEDEIDIDSGEIIVEKRMKSTCFEVYELFKEILGTYPANWKVNKTQRVCAENLYAEHGIEAIRNALKFYKENQDMKFVPFVTSPYDLDSKWKKLTAFKKKNNL